MNNNISCQVKILLKLAENNKSREIYTILNNLNCSTTFKGNVFENFLAELYQKIGWDTKVVGGKNDKGADILLFNSKQKVHAIIQVKNTKRPVSKKEIVNECDNFIGIYNPGTAKKYTCDTLMIFSLNGYTKGAWNYNYPATHKIFRYEWSYIESLIQFYANSFPKFKKKSFPKKSKKIIIPIIILVIYLKFSNFTNFPTMLTTDMITKLNHTSFSSLLKQDCKRLNYPLLNCREQLVYKYAQIYGSLQEGLIVYFCGPTNFKNGDCGDYGKKMANYIIGK